MTNVKYVSKIKEWWNKLDPDTQYSIKMCAWMAVPFIGLAIGKALGDMLNWYDVIEITEPIACGTRTGGFVWKPGTHKINHGADLGLGLGALATSIKALYFLERIYEKDW